MTWLSRLLPQANRIRPRSERRRDLTAKQRRRIAALEGLEDRTVLSSVTTTPNFISGALTITADRFNNQFSVAEFKDGGVTKVTITALDASTLVNGGTSWTSLGSVSSITINLQSGAAADHDVIDLYGEGKDAAQSTKNVTIKATKTNLDLSVHDINNPGAFSLTTAGRLNLSMDSARWSSLSVSQTGCCPAVVDITNTNVSGKVTVAEGWGNNSSISVDNSVFGATVLSQYNGAQPKLPNCNGDNDSISVTDSQVQTLDINQCGGNGKNNSVVVDGLLVAQANGTYFGVDICQGNGDNDSVVVNDVNVFGRPNLRVPPTAGINVLQGCGANDTVEVTNSTVPGDVTVVQGCGVPCDVDENGNIILTPSGANVSVTIDNVNAGLPGSYGAGAISVTQGDGRNSDASITNSTTAELDVSITQGDLEQDDATIDAVDSGGGIYITQGAAAYDFSLKPTDFHAPDTASITNSTSGGNVVITQCDIPWPLIPIPNTNPVQFYQWDGNTATIDAVDADGTIWISQGDKDGDTASITNVTVLVYGDVCINQGDGDGDSATIDNAVIVAHDNDKPPYWSGNIYIVQGNGDGDDASITNSVSDFYLWITQGEGDGDTALIDASTSRFQLCIEQGNGDGDSATISNSEVTHVYPDDEVFYYSVYIYQGNGDGDSATISCVTTPQDAYVFQGDGNLDVITVLGLVAGSVDNSGGFPLDVHGNVTLVQGDGYADLIVVDDCDGVITEVNNLYIYQGDSLPYDGCEEGLSDTVIINDTFITSDLYIQQGFGDGETGFGYYVVEIGTDSSVSGVEAYGYTTIWQAGEGNTVLMGEDPFEGTTGSFITTWLDVWQGSGGGAFAWVANTEVQYGSAIFDYNFNAGDGGNTFVDNGGNSNVTYSDAYNA